RASGANAQGRSYGGPSPDAHNGTHHGSPGGGYEQIFGTHEQAPCRGARHITHDELARWCGIVRAPKNSRPASVLLLARAAVAHDKRGSFLIRREHAGHGDGNGNSPGKNLRHRRGDARGPVARRGSLSEYVSPYGNVSNGRDQ